MTRDIVGLTVNITGPTAAGSYATSLNSITISGTASDNVGVAGVSYVLSGATVASGDAAGTGSWNTGALGLSLGAPVTRRSSRTR
ncbi:MAG: hypothetical protein IH989_07410 [Planctomycetes bacterium]|nr:hypothetical protein [Planctomycetota bacterium]